MSKYKSPAPDGQDLQAALNSLQKDYGVCCRQTLSPLPDGRLAIDTVAWREVEGVRLGIAQERREWSPSGLPLLSFLLASVHRVYWKTSDMAHNGARKYGMPKLG